jgi:hypothetical protein
MDATQDREVQSFSDAMGRNEFMAPKVVAESGRSFYLTESRHDPNNVFEGKAAPRYLFTIEFEDSPGELYTLALGETIVRETMHNKLNEANIIVGPVQLVQKDTTWHFKDVSRKQPTEAAKAKK